MAGLLVERSLAGTLGHSTRWTSAGLLFATGLHAVAASLRSRRKGNEHADVAGQHTGRLLVMGATLSIDNWRSGSRSAATT